MKKLLLSFAFFPLFPSFFLASSAFSRAETNVQGDNVVIYNSSEAKAEGSNARTESSVSTTVNGGNVTVKTDQPGSVEVKNIDGKVEIKTSDGITPTIIITGVPTQNIKIGETEQLASSTAFSKTINNRTSSIYSFLKGLFTRVFGSFLRKT